MEQLLGNVFNDLVAPQDFNPDINFFPEPDGDAQPFTWENGLYYMSLEGLSESTDFQETILNDDTEFYFFSNYRGENNNPNSFNHETCNN